MEDQRFKTEEWVEVKKLRGKIIEAIGPDPIPHGTVVVCLVGLLTDILADFHIPPENDSIAFMEKAVQLVKDKIDRRKLKKENT